MSGSTPSGWVEGILLSLTALAVLTIIISSFNVLYNKNYDLGLSDNETETKFIEYQETSQTGLEGGEVSFDSDQGITLKNSYGIAIDAVKITWDFISGGWIENIINKWNTGESGTALAKAIRIIYFLSLVFGILYALFKVVI